MSKNSANILDGDAFRGWSFSELASENLSAAKGGAALTVMAGHYGTGIPDFWVVVTVGLLVFSISSGYFTWHRYHGEFSWRRFWRRKAARLIPNLIVIELFLFILFSAQGSEGLWSWHTVFNLAGLNGFLNWFHISNESPYGRGMWFLTLLLIFYTIYPLLERLYRGSGSIVTTIGGILCLFILNRTVEYGHALWLTGAGFLVGIFMARHKLRLHWIASAGMAASAAIGMVASHIAFGFDAANFFFILAVAASGVFFLLEIRLPLLFNRVGSWLSGILLQVYLLHPYINVVPTKLHLLDATISAALVLLLAAALSWVGDEVRRYVRAYG